MKYENDYNKYFVGTLCYITNTEYINGGWLLQHSYKKYKTTLLQKIDDFTFIDLKTRRKYKFRDYISRIGDIVVHDATPLLEFCKNNDIELQTNEKISRKKLVKAIGKSIDKIDNDKTRE